MYETFEHTADLGLRARAADLDTLFGEAAKALFSTLASLDDVLPRVERRLELTGSEIDYLLFDWLSELLYLFDREHLLLCQFDVAVDEHGLRATVRGEPVDPARHRLEHEVKAITYHGLRVEQTADGWQSEVIVDI